MKYEIIYCRQESLRNSDGWHWEYGDLNKIKAIVDWCIEKGLVIKSVKAVK